jgi:UDP-glucose/galactose:(glucosyl)LPS alpha-1,2-glucosyl/galactosyltransferase
MKTALVLACDDNFIAYASVVARRAASLSSDKFPIVIISDAVSEENKRLAQKFCPQITFIEASHLFGEARFYTTAALTRATYLRLYLDEILADFDRVTYIDSDMTPLVDLSPLLKMAPKASPVMATYSLGPNHSVYNNLPLSREAGYLQGGLQIYDLKAIREEGIFKRAIEFAHQNPEKCLLVDQDALNVVLQGRWQVLDWRWNVMNPEARYLPKPFYIRHHGGVSKPWSADKSECEHYIVKFWEKDLAESPWPQKFSSSEKKLFFYKRYFKPFIRPLTRAIEVRIKATMRGDLETMYHGEWEQKQIKRYRRRLPSTLAKIEEAAREGSLAGAL